MKKIILMSLSIIFQSCKYSNFSDENCHIVSVNSITTTDKKYHYTVYCKMGVFEFYSDSIYNIEQKIRITK